MTSKPTATFDAYVRQRLRDWGHEFMFGRDHEDLGYNGKNMIAVLMEHHGEMPSKPTGYKPMTMPEMEWQIECVVREMHAELPHLALVLRAYYCGSGRISHERKELAEHLIGKSFSRRVYYTYHDLAFNRVAGILLGIARAA
jgi:hypothetical protein